MKKALFSLLFLCFLMINLAKAQDTTATKCNKKANECSSECSTKKTNCSTKKSRFFYDIGIGGQFIEIGSLNAKFTEAGFNEAYTRPLTTTIAFGMINGKHVLGWNLGFTNATNSRNNQSTQLSSFRGEVNYGYALKLSNRFTFVPTIGLGIIENRMTLQKNTNSNATTLTGALAGSLTSTTLTGDNGGAVFGTRFIFKIKKDKRSAITLNMNYYLPFHDYNWRANGQDISDVPKANFGGFTVTLGFGLF
jgi:hypothetical protein